MRTGIIIFLTLVSIYFINRLYVSGIKKGFNAGVIAAKEQAKKQ